MRRSPRVLRGSRQEVPRQDTRLFARGYKITAESCTHRQGTRFHKPIQNPGKNRKPLVKKSFYPGEYRILTDSCTLVKKRPKDWLLYIFTHLWSNQRGQNHCPRARQQGCPAPHRGMTGTTTTTASAADTDSMQPAGVGGEEAGHAGPEQCPNGSAQYTHCASVSCSLGPNLFLAWPAG